MQVNAQNRSSQWNRTATTDTRQVEDWLEKKLVVGRIFGFEIGPRFMFGLKIACKQK